MPQFPAVLELSSLNGTNGFKLSGAVLADQSGFFVSSADVNGDGFSDLIIGAPYADPNGLSASGTTYVVFGKASGFAANINLSSLNGSNGFAINGEAAGDYSGYSVSSAGDVNGDGFADVIIGAEHASPNGSHSGASYVVFGHASGFSANFNLSTLNGANGFKISGGAVNDLSGVSVASAGDVNGDGFDDVIVGASKADANGIVYAGMAYVVFGHASGFTASINVTNLNGTNGFQLSGVTASDFTGNSVHSAGDVNGDGFDDIIIGALLADPNGTSSGAAYVVFGHASGFAANLNLSTLSGTNGFQLSGAAAGYDTGYSVSSAGDINGDGFADVIVGAYHASPNGTQSGAAYVVFGKASGFAATLSLSALDGTNGFKLSGAVAGDLAGVSVSSAGDFNGDGFDDLIVSADGGDQNGVNSGAVYLVFGKPSGFAANLNLSALDGNSGFRIDGVTVGDLAGNSVSAAGDVNHDGFDDLIVGAVGADPNASASGASYVIFGSAGNFGPTVNLGTPNGVTGFQISGGAINDYSGVSVSSAGDVNGDGFDDVIVGAYKADANGVVFAGMAYVVFGKASGFSPNVNVSSLNGTNGFKLSGVAASDLTGYSVSSAGDMNGDGFDDVIVGAYHASPNGTHSGAAYVVFGKAGGYAANFNLSALDGTNGFKLSGATLNDDSGNAVHSAGDVNGDGFADVIVGAYLLDANGVADSGGAYVVFGKASGFAANFNLSSVNGTNGFQLSGEAATDFAGSAVASAGDVNNDGYDDLIVGAVRNDANGLIDSGAAYVVFGKPGGFGANINLSSLVGTNGFKISGIVAGDLTGYSVSSAGDVNGDGFADVIVGASQASPNGTHSGSAYVVFGGAGFGANLQLSNLNGLNGFRINGAAATDDLGVSVSSAGDINGDGFDDMLVGAFLANSNGADTGSAYVIYGKASGFDSILNVSNLNGTNGFRINGRAPGDLAGNSVSAAGDVNGDGFADLIIGAVDADPNGANSGASYVLFGRMPTTAVALTGTGASQTLAGGNFNDTLTGGGGNDTLYGHGGNDVLDGGSGTDMAVFAGLRAGYAINTASGITTVSGADGTDTLTNIELLKFSDSTIAATGRIVRRDFDGDGKSDILFQGPDGTIGAWLMNGGTLASGTTYAQLGGGFSIAGSADFNGDGKSDLLFQNTDGTVGMWLLNGASILSPANVGNDGTSTIKGLGDFNGDGKADVFFQNTDNTVGMWFMNGPTLASGASVTTPGAGWSVAGLGDFNGDGKADILWQNTDTTIGMWMMNGSTIATPATVGMPGPGSTIVGIGDFDGDGKSDILFQNTDTTVGIWFMNGGSLVSGGSIGAPGAGWSVKAIGDYNGDAKSDIVWQYTDGTVGMWMMNGATIMTPATVGASAWSIVAGVN